MPVAETFRTPRVTAGGARAYTAHGDLCLKVDHAGEHGAVHIYRGQIAVARWRCPELVPPLREFLAHEERHRESFRVALAERGVRRCLSYPLCAVGGWALGALTALCGRGAIGATTVAVERVVLRHLDSQLALFATEDAHAYSAVAAIVNDERAHRDAGAEIAGDVRGWLRVLMPVVAVATELVIRTGMWLPARRAPRGSAPQ